VNKTYVLQISRQLRKKKWL